MTNNKEKHFGRAILKSKINKIITNECNNQIKRYLTSYK